MDALLGLMCASYSWPIIYVYRQYYIHQNPNVSDIIMFKPSIIICMAVMAMFTIMYEIKRNDSVSLACICALLVGIIGLLCTKSYKHFAMVTIAFVAIIAFMLHHCLRAHSIALWLLFFAQVIGTLILISLVTQRMFLTEVFLVANFAVFYFYIHFTCCRH